ncbi:MAG: TrkA C-terminal domain-containing protein [Pseudomonadota bacterium]
MDSTPAKGKSIISLNLPKDVLVGIIIRDTKTIIPDSSTIINSGDFLIIVCHTESVKNIENIFASNFEYF